jgi:hypothetical protein
VQSFVEEMIARLARAEVEYVIVGGVSAVLQGVPVVTQDLDLCYRRTPENLTRLAAALAPLQPRLRGLPPDLPVTFDERALRLGTNFTLLVGDEHLDLLAGMSALGGYEQIFAGVDDMVVGGFHVKVLRLPELIATKEAAGRAKDLAVLPLLRATLESKRAQQSGQEP